jgi:hypothetical protein
MKTFYFVGGPNPGMHEQFSQRLKEIGGPPKGWTIYPHSPDDGKALHLVSAGSRQDILDHIVHFADLYTYGEIIEIHLARS